MKIISRPVKNFSAGRDGYKPLVICLHITDGSKQSVFYTFDDTSDPLLRSAHYLVDKSGTVYALVKEEDTAWGDGRVHNPVSIIVREKLGVNPNLYSINIETEGVGWSNPNPAQYSSLVELVKDIAARWNIPLDKDHIIRHNEVYSLKACPGLLDRDKVLALATVPPAHTNPQAEPVPNPPFAVHSLSILDRLINYFKK